MRLLPRIVVLALGWIALTGSLSFENLLLGLVLSTVASVVAGRAPSWAGRLRPTRVVRFALFYALQVMLSSARIAYEVLTPRLRAKPAVIAVPIDLPLPWQAALLANLITMTPGTLALDVSADGRTLYVHAMYAADPEELRASLKDQFERRVREAMA